MKRARPRGFRLVDGVVVAAVALLALKVLTLMSSGRAAEPDGPASDGSPPFAQVLAHARTNYEPSDVATTGSVHAEPKPEPKPSASEAPPRDAPMPSAAPPVSPAERQILEKLGERRDELRQKSNETDQRERLLEESERRLDQRLDQLKSLQQKSEGVPERKAEENEALKNLVTMYESMKPKDAAKVFDRLPQSVLVSVVTQMKPRKMSEILAAMSPAGAEKLTVALATRGQAPPVGAANALPAGELPAIEALPVRR